MPQTSWIVGRCSALVLVALLVPSVVSSARAELSALGDAFQVSPPGPVGASNQRILRNRHVGVADDGSFVVVWTTGTIGSVHDIAGQRFDAAGAAVGTEFAVNSYTTLDQRRPAVATTSNGFIAVWNSANTDGAQSAVLARRFDPSAAGIGNDFIVNTYTTDDQLRADVSVAADDSFVVVWASQFPDGSEYGIFAQRFAAGGAPSGSEFQVSQVTTGSQDAPSVSHGGDGFSVVWSDTAVAGPPGPIVTARCYDASGQPASAELLVSRPSTRATGFAIDGNAQGAFVVAWTGPPDGQYGSAVRARRYASTVAPLLCGDAALRIGPAPDARTVTATDALFILRVAVAVESCELCVCDVDGSGSVAASDALVALKFAVGQQVVLACPACS